MRVSMLKSLRRLRDDGTLYLSHGERNEGTILTDQDVMGTTEAAEYLGMKKSNLGKFLERRGISPDGERPSGPVWNRGTLERVRAIYLADTEKVRADNRRRNSALGLPTEGYESEERMPSIAVRIGGTQRAVLTEMYLDPTPLPPKAFELRHIANENSVKQALYRLAERGFVQRVGTAFALTELGREAAGSLDV